MYNDSMNIKNKTSIISVILLVVICMLLLNFSFQNQKKYELTEKIKCGEEANKYINTYKPGLLIDDNSEVIESRFNKKLNTCLAKIISSGLSLDYTISYSTYSIVDIYSNQILITYTTSHGNGKVETMGDPNEFNKLSKKYFDN